MYVSTFDKDLLANDGSAAKVLKRISAVGRRTSDSCLVPPKIQSVVGSQTECLLQYLAQIGESGWISVNANICCCINAVLTVYLCIDRSQWSSSSMSDCSARGPGIESHCGQLSLL